MSQASAISQSHKHNLAGVALSTHPAAKENAMFTTQVRELARRSEPYLYAALRIVAGALFAFHGAQKILGWYGQFTPPFGSQIWIGGIIELVGGALIALGLFTRPVAFLVSGQMAVAYIQFHWKFALAGGMWLPAINKGELAAIYCFLFLFIAAHGSGGLAALDGRLRRQAH
jgi:putative oxidoreductase